MKNIFSGFFLSVLIIISFSSCKEETKKTEADKTIEPKLELVKAPVFSEDSAYYFIEKQVKFGQRILNSKAHNDCGDYLIKTFKKYKAEVIVQSFAAEAFDGTKLNSRNIIASYFPKAPRRILLTAHWDTRPFSDQDDDKAVVRKPIDGANDGGSGVGVLLEIARVLSLDTNQNSQVGVDIILFDSEDNGTPEFEKPLDQGKQYYCLGSQYWSKNKHKADYSAYFGILFDMVGAKNATFGKEGTSMQFAGSVVNKVWEISQKIGYGQFFVNANVAGIIDDHLYVNQDGKIPTIDIIECRISDPESFKFSESWHTQEDNMSVIDKKTLKAVGQTVIQVIYQEKASTTAL